MERTIAQDTTGTDRLKMTQNYPLEKILKTVNHPNRDPLFSNCLRPGVPVRDQHFRLESFQSLRLCPWIPVTRNYNAIMPQDSLNRSLEYANKIIVMEVENHYVPRNELHFELLVFYISHI